MSAVLRNQLVIWQLLLLHEPEVIPFERACRGACQVRFVCLECEIHRSLL